MLQTWEKFRKVRKDAMGLIIKEFEAEETALSHCIGTVRSRLEMWP